MVIFSVIVLDPTTDMADPVTRGVYDDYDKAVAAMKMVIESIGQKTGEFRVDEINPNEVAVGDITVRIELTKMGTRPVDATGTYINTGWGD